MDQWMHYITFFVTSQYFENENLHTSKNAKRNRNTDASHPL